MERMSASVYPVIMAGGAGTRLWPYSRRRLPKQLRPLVGERTMLQTTVDRMAAVAPPEHVFIVTNREYLDTVRDQVPSVPAHQVVGEPEGLGTAPAVGLAAALVKARDPNGVLACFPADHVIRPRSGFRKTVARATAAAEAGRVVVIGIPPHSPDTGYGYIELGAPDDPTGCPAVASFREKPDRETAEEYVDSGRFLWNAGLFIWSVPTVFEEYRACLPNLAAQMESLVTAVHEGRLEARLPEVWAAITDRTTVDYGIMERTTRAVCVAADFEWSDVGSWDALDSVLDADEQGNVVAGTLLGHDSRDCIVFAPTGRTVAAIGLRGAVIVDTDDVVLVCPRERAQEVRAIVAALKEEGSDLL